MPRRAASGDSPRSVGEERDDAEEAYFLAVGDYKHGSITRIKLKHFLTYSDVEVHPKPRLNMVVGPNGTGKSSILCAVCLGLGGEPRLLGRASEVESFIQTGEDEAYIEIELANEKGKNPVITRTIRNEEGKVHAKSIYTWDGEVVSAKRVRERAAQEYQIQIDNLCTFLPQEKVGNFSGFDSKMLLLETEKTLSPNKHLFEEHQRLIRLQEELHGGDDQVESLQQRLEHLKKDLSRMEREVKRMEELEEDRKMADLLEKKILWLKSKELEEACVLLRAQKEKIKEQYREGMEEIKPLEQAHQKAVQKLEDARMELQRYESEVTGHKKEMERQKEKYETHDDRIEEILSELHSLEDNRAKLEKRVEDARTKVQELERMVDSRPASLEDLEAEKKRLIEEKQSLQEEYNRKRDREHEMSIQKSELENDMKVTQRDLARLNDEKAVLRQRFFVGNPDTQRAYDWIQANRAQFRREVLGPIACEVNLESDETAAYLEQHVSNNVLKSFVVGDKSDYNLLYNEVRVRQKIPINIIVIERVPEPKPRMYSHEKMDILKREHGIVGYLDETFQAPEVVMEALKSSSQIEKVLVGTNQTQISMDDKNLGGFLSESENGGRRTQGFCVFTADKGKSFKYLATVSKYSGYLNMRVDDVRAAKWLKRGTNEERKQEKERRLKEQKRHLEELIPSWNVAKNEHDDSLQSLQDAQGSVNQVTQQIQLSQKCITKLRSARLKLENFEAQLAVDDEKEKSDKIEHLNQRIRNSLKALKAHSASYKRMLAATVSASGARLLKEAAVNEERTCKHDFTVKKKALEEIEARMKTVKEKLSQKKQDAQRAKLEANERAPLIDDDGEDTELKEKLDVDLGHFDYIEQAEASLEEVQERINNTVEDANVIRNYEQMQRELNTTEAQLDALTRGKEQRRTDMLLIAEPWETSLERILTKVDSRFSRYMDELGCVGAVRLRKGDANAEEEEARYADYAVEILVSFRDGVAPTVLSAQVQSGGERSVSTIMYLMAMQDMMVAPFRCVDEINQGLDERNERLVFKRIVENSTKPPGSKGPTDHCGQYWLITPKLLPNLVDMEVEAMNVLCIFNGPFNLKRPRDWNVEHLLDLRKQARVDTGDNEEE